MSIFILFYKRPYHICMINKSFGEKQASLLYPFISISYSADHRDKTIDSINRLYNNGLQALNSLLNYLRIANFLLL